MNKFKNWLRKCFGVKDRLELELEAELWRTKLQLKHTKAQLEVAQLNCLKSKVSDIS